MREAYHEQLGSIGTQLGDMCGLVSTAIEEATKALLQADLGIAEQVIGDDVKVDEIRSAAEEQSFNLLALQAPVAGDLRTVVSVIHIADDLERMGDLALHVAKAARRRHPQPVLPAEVAGYFEEMGRVAVLLAGQAEKVLREQDIELAAQMESTDDQMDDLHKHLFTLLMSPEWPHGVATAVDVTLLGRFYERFADHAVAVARRVIYVVTGSMPNIED
ncbi:phosphate transport system regulatory protein PhoU [Pseudonocardiaceae bacterium YIM PH 21723]|nr:phosphate transport system regulatory protein PhoU [Pseudonocardiaceae bacterium YIM PH 21723]